MRLVISTDTFIVEGVPRGVDLSDLRAFCGVSWDGRRRRLVVPLCDAGMLTRHLEQRGVRLADHEVREAVAGAFEHDPIHGPARVARYGDARAIPELSRALDLHAPRDCAFTDYLIALGLGTAIQILGGAPTEPQRGKIMELERLQRDFWPDGGEETRAMLAAVAPLATTPLAASDGPGLPRAKSKPTQH
jgi:hypothetical protein